MVDDIQLLNISAKTVTVVNVILHTLNCKNDFYGYCCDYKVCTTGVTPVLKLRE